MGMHEIVSDYFEGMYKRMNAGKLSPLVCVVEKFRCLRSDLMESWLFLLDSQSILQRQHPSRAWMGIPWVKEEGQSTWPQRAINLRAVTFLWVWTSITPIYDLRSKNTLIPTKAKTAYTSSKWLISWLYFSIASSPLGHVIWACWKEYQRMIDFIKDSDFLPLPLTRSRWKFYSFTYRSLFRPPYLGSLNWSPARRGSI